jgi:hypothetical protein
MNLNKRNIFLTLVLTLISASSFYTVQADFLDHKSIELEQLHLYKIIIGVKATCLSERIETLQQKGNTSKDFDLTAQSSLKFIELALQEMNDIVVGLNKGILSGNIEIEYKFVNLCNFLQDKEITPRSLRELRTKVNEFDIVLKEFCRKKKYYLKPEAFELVNKMIRLNHILIQGVLHDNYFDLSMTDLALDLIFHRPLEFAQNHKLLIGGTLLIACGIIAAIYGYPSYVRYQLENRNPNYQCHQLHGFSQPIGSGDCALYSLVHTLLMMNPAAQNQAQGPVNLINADVMQERLNAIPSLNPVIEGMQGIIRNHRDADRNPNVPENGWLTADEVELFLAPDALHGLAAQLQAIGINEQAIDFQDIHIMENLGFLARGQGIPDWLPVAVDRFRRLNRPQGIVLFTHGHWVALRLQRDAQGVIQPLMIDSALYNITNHPIVNQVIQLFTQQPFASPYGLANITPSIDNATGILNGNADYASDADRHAAVLNHLRRAIDGIQGSPADQRAQEFAYYQQSLTGLFNNLRNTCLALNLHQVALEQAPYIINFDNIENIDQLIIALVGHPFA